VCIPVPKPLFLEWDSWTIRVVKILRRKLRRIFQNQFSRI
jgi:hypothetical protein